MEIRGVDISYCQNGLDYVKLKEDGIRFALIRAGVTGTGSHKQFRDDLLHVHVNGCIGVGIPYGFYFYSCARSAEEARIEAKFCVEQIKDYPLPGYPVFYDAEEAQIADNGKTVATDIALAFIDEVERLGYPSGIYCNPSWMEGYLDKSRLVNNKDIWLAHWVTKTNCKYGQKIWQNGLTYSAGMKIDSDICFVNYPQETEAWYAARGKVIPAVIPKRSVDEIIDEIWLGLWGCGTQRFERLIAAGYDYYEIMDELNRRLAEEAEKSSAKINVGSSVMLKQGAGTYDGKRLATFVSTRAHVVSELHGDRAVITYNGVVVAAVNVMDLTAV